MNENSNKENKPRRVFGNNIQNGNLCSASEHEWPLESYTNPSPLLELTNKIELRNFNAFQYCEHTNGHNAKKTVTNSGNENIPPPYCYRAICPTCKETNWALRKSSRTNQSPKKLTCHHCKVDFCEECRCSPFHRRTESCPSRLNKMNLGGKLFKKMR